MPAFAHWRVTLVFGRLTFSCHETALDELAAINHARRYAAACGYTGEPDRTYSRRTF